MLPTIEPPGLESLQTTTAPTKMISNPRALATAPPESLGAPTSHPRPHAKRRRKACPRGRARCGRSAPATRSIAGCRQDVLLAPIDVVVREGRHFGAALGDAALARVARRARRRTRSEEH